MNTISVYIEVIVSRSYIASKECRGRRAAVTNTTTAAGTRCLVKNCQVSFVFNLKEMKGVLRILKRPINLVLFLKSKVTSAETKGITHAIKTQ